ncbi:hypothetical protein JYU34_022569, partial [Plutella xylostella]
PNNSLVRPYSPKSTTNLAGSYNRPQPPPYLGSATNSLHHRKSGNTEHTPSHLVLEETLKLLNEAKIGGDYIDDLNSEPAMKTRLSISTMVQKIMCRLKWMRLVT